MVLTTFALSVLVQRKLQVQVHAIHALLINIVKLKILHGCQN